MEPADNLIKKTPLNCEGKSEVSHTKDYSRLVLNCSSDKFHMLHSSLKKKLHYTSWCDSDRASSLIRGNKRPTGCNRMVFIAKIIVRSTCFGHHYAHHQELKSYTDGCCLWYTALRFTGRCNLQLHTRPTTCKPNRHVPQAANICITLELLMVGIVVPETCWADNKFWNKNRSIASSWPFISTY